MSNLFDNLLTPKHLQYTLCNNIYCELVFLTEYLTVASPITEETLNLFNSSCVLVLLVHKFGCMCKSFLVDFLLVAVLLHTESHCCLL